MDERKSHKHPPESHKHPPVKTVPLEQVQAILRSAVNGRTVGLEEAIRTLNCDAHHADRVLRQMAEAEYLEPADILDGLFYWQLTPNGTRLAMEPKRKRIVRDKVQAIVSEIHERA
jgi:DNA-binding IclR family transcriptional regulator